MASTQGLANQKTDPLVEPEKGAPTLTDIKEGDEFYQRIKADFENAGLIVAYVERLENHSLWDRYTNESDLFKKQLSELGSDFDLNERYLYHGTNGSKDIFMEEEIDNRLSKKGCFGPGIYFSDNPKKCAKYAERGTSEKFILLCRVILGESKVYPKGLQDRGLKREPNHPNPKKRFYDSVQGSPRNYNEFVIYEKRRALVECIITFTRKPEDQLSSSVEALTQGIEPETFTAAPESICPDIEDSGIDDDNESICPPGSVCPEYPESICSEYPESICSEYAETICSEYPETICSDGEDSNDDFESVKSGDGRGTPVKDDTSDSGSDTEKDDDSGEDTERECGDISSDEEDNVKVDTSSDEEYEDVDNSCVKSRKIPLYQNDEALQQAIKDFMDKTNEPEELVAKFYIIMEDLDVEVAVTEYNKPYTVEFSPDEEEEMNALVAEIESELKVTEHTSESIEAMNAEDKETAISQLVSKFCVIVGLNKSEGKATARKYLTMTKWETDLAMLAYFEEEYGI